MCGLPDYNLKLIVPFLYSNVFHELLLISKLTRLKSGDISSRVMLFVILYYAFHRELQSVSNTDKKLRLLHVFIY